MNDRTRGALRPIQLGVFLLLTLFSGIASALGLGDIRVLSRPGEPLLAEITIISEDPSELEQLHVSLASPSAFARVGLEPPSGVVSELQFELSRNAQGRAVVRVTSHAPVETASLSFLIMADWAQGRLLREYSVLVDAPDRAVAISEPLIEGPTADQANRIQRDVLPLDETAAPAPTAAPAARQASAAASAPRAQPAAAPVAPGGTLAPVRQGQTLSQIAGAVARDSGRSLEETMVALLRANPDAFIRGNMHLLKQGAVLRTPPADELARLDAAQARAIVREQTAQWRQARAPIQQPAASGATAPVATAAAGAGAPDTTQARLEIAPSLADGDGAAGMKTGTSAMGEEGDILANQQLREAREDIATRDAEIQELRDRVADLEKLQTQQQALISMKDSDLAAAQQRLAQSSSSEAGGGSGLVWIGLLVLVGAGIAWFVVSRRRRPSPLPPLARDGFDADAMAATLPAAAVALDTADVPGLAERDDARREQQEQDHAQEREGALDLTAGWPAASVPAPVEPASAAQPAQGWEQSPAAAPAFVLEERPGAASDGVVFDWPAEDAARDVAPEPAPAPVVDPWQAPAPATGRERLELAIAYLDLGDADTARTLLREVAAGTDPQSRDQAIELLSRL